MFDLGDAGDGMYVVQEGEVEIIVNARVVETVTAGGIVGEMALIDKGPRSARVVAKTGARLVKVNPRRFEFLVQQTPFFAIEVMKLLAQRLRNMDKLL